MKNEWLVDGAKVTQSEYDAIVAKFDALAAKAKRKRLVDNVLLVFLILPLIFVGSAAVTALFIRLVRVLLGGTP